MAEEEVDFICLRCNEKFKLPYTPGIIKERACPKCGSNSVRRIKNKKEK
jgi:rRNA maturation endonuclease Nob1